MSLIQRHCFRRQDLRGCKITFSLLSRSAKNNVTAAVGKIKFYDILSYYRGDCVIPVDESLFTYKWFVDILQPLVALQDECDRLKGPKNVLLQTLR